MQPPTHDLISTLIKLSKFYIACIIFLLTVLGNANGQVVGDYGTRYSDGTYTWNQPENWLVCVTANQWTDAIVATSVPGTNNNVWIRTGSVCSMDANPGSCKNLTVCGTLANCSSNSVLNIGGNLEISNGVICDINSNQKDLTLNVAGAFNVNPNKTASIQSVVLNISLTTNISGTINFETNPNGAKIFNSIVTILTGGVWNNTDNQALTFKRGITNSGMFNAGAGIHTFEGSDQALTGSFSISNTTVNSIKLKNTNNLTVSTALNGTGGIIQGSNATLNIGGTCTLTTLTANGSVNTVNYSGAAQTVYPTIYSNLTLSGSGTKTTTGVTVNGILSMEGDGTVNVTVLPKYNSASTLQYNGSAAQLTGLEFPSSFNNASGVIINNPNGVTLNSQKTITGSLAILNGAILSLGSFSSSANTLNLGGSGQAAGTWGGVDSQAFFKNGTYFGSGVAGILTVKTKSCIAGLWIGVSSTDWDTGTNWCDGLKPTSATDVTINPGGYQPIIGADASCRNLTINSGGSLEILGSKTLTISGNFSNNGTFTANSSTVNYNGVVQSVGTADYFHLTLSNSGNKTTVADLKIDGNLIVKGKCSFTLAGYNLIVNGTTTIGDVSTGSIYFTSTTGTKIFKGLVTINNGAAWNNTANSQIEFQGGITSFSSIFNPGTGVQSFTTNSQTLNSSGNISIPNVTISGINLTNNSKLTIGSSLTGSGIFTQASGSELHIEGNSTIQTLDASNQENTVYYSGPYQIIKSADYYHLILSGSTSTKTLAGPVTVKGNLTINTNITLNTAYNGLSLAGNFVNNGILTVLSSPIFITGSINQNIAGFTTSGPVTITKSAGTATLTGVLTAGSIIMNGTGGILNLGTITTHTTNTLIFGTDLQSAGFWGGTGSGAQFINSTYFAASAGKLKVSCVAGLWTGTKDNDWNTGNNWCDGLVPTSLTNVMINSGDNQPKINTAAFCRDISIDTGASLSISGPNTLAISGNAVNNGTFTATGPGTIKYINPGGGQTVMGGTYSNLTLNNSTGIQTANGSLVVIDTLVTTAGGVLDLGNSHILGGALSSIFNNGTIKTSVPTSVSPFPLPGGKTWGGEIIYYGSSPQTLVPGTYTNLTIDNSPGAFLNDTLMAANVIGKLWIKNGKSIQIGTKAELIVGSIQNDAGTSGIIIKAGSNIANGTLIFKDIAPQATVEMYSISSWNLSDLNSTNRYKWQYFGIPVQTVRANPTFEGSYVRKWYESGITASKWLQQGNDSILSSFLGYELCKPTPSILVIKGQLENRDFDSGQLSYTPGALYQGQHIFANPYTASIDIRNLTFGMQTEATVYLYNAGSYSDWSGQNLPGNGPGQYTAIPKETAGLEGIPFEIPSMQAMLVKARNNSNDATFGINYHSVITKNTVRQRVKPLSGKESSDQVCTVIDVKGINYSDRMWIFSNKKCSHRFDNGWDGSKLTGSALSPHIYAVETDGNYQVDTVDDMNNTEIGFLPGEDENYTLTFTHSNLKNNYAGLYLRDNVENKTIDVTESGSVYSFISASGSVTANRFTLITRPCEKDATDSPELKLFTCKNIILVQNLSSTGGVVNIYDIAGHYLKKEVLLPGGITTITGIIPGAYVAKAFTGKGGVTKQLLVQ